jgi:hypothetical protein
MKELLEGLRGPALGLVIMFLAVAGMLVTAAFAALVAQMSLLLRLRPRENKQTGSGAARSSQSASSQVNRSPKISVEEPKTEEIVDAVWWQEMR